VHQLVDRLTRISSTPHGIEGRGVVDLGTAAAPDAVIHAGNPAPVETRTAANGR